MLVVVVVVVMIMMMMTMIFTLPRGRWWQDEVLEWVQSESMGGRHGSLGSWATGRCRR
jgi:hypothetical protein